MNETKLNGYVELSEDQKNGMNYFKDREYEFLADINRALQISRSNGLQVNVRLINIAKEHFELAFMALSKAIARPYEVY